MSVAMKAAPVLNACDQIAKLVHVKLHKLGFVGNCVTGVYEILPVYLDALI